MLDKIIFLLNSPYPYYTGGRETWLNNVANCLIDQYEIVVIAENSINIDNLTSRWKIDSRIRIINVKSLLSYRITNWLLRSYLDYYHCFFRAAMMRRALLRQVRNGQKTYIIAMDTVFLPLVFRRLKKNDCIETIISSRGPHAEIYGSNWPLKKKRILKIERKNLTVADRIWSNGYDTQLLLQNKGFASTVIYNGVDCKHIMNESLPPHKAIQAARGIRIGTIGTLLDLKGYPIMIHAIKRVIELQPGIDIDLFAFGKGDSYGYEQLAKSIGVERNIHFLGEDKDAPLYIKQTDLLLALGTSEGSGMSMAALEMLASGVPVIATNIPCYQQLIENGKNGFLVSEGDANELAKLILYVVRISQDEKEQIRKEAFKRCWQFDWAQVERRIINELEKR